MDLILLHGAIGAAIQLDPLANALQDGFTIHNLDLKGHGKAAVSHEPYSIRAFGEAILHYMDSLQIERAAIFGYSLGGYVGAFVAAHYSDRVQRLATLGTKYQWSPEVASNEIKMLDPEKIEQKVAAYARTLRQRHLHNDWKTVLARTADLLISLGQDPPLTYAVLSSITVPALLLVGDRDKMVPPDETLSIYKALPGAAFGVLPCTPHPIEQVDVNILSSHLRLFFNTQQEE